jgi:hypothetical protein
MSSKVNVRILFASFWICHFLLWTFGDFLSLLQGANEPITETIIMIIAPTLAVTQTIMVVLSLTAKLKYVRWANLGVPLVFLLFNVQYLSEYSEVWNYILGTAYVLYNLLIIWNAWKLSPE